MAVANNKVDTGTVWVRGIRRQGRKEEERRSSREVNRRCMWGPPEGDGGKTQDLYRQVRMGERMWELGRKCENWGKKVRTGEEMWELGREFWELGRKCENWGEKVRTGERRWELGRECEYWGEKVRTVQRMWELGRECENWGENVRTGKRMVLSCMIWDLSYITIYILLLCTQ